MFKAMKHLDWLGWFYSLMAAVVGGASSAVSAAIGVGLIDPDKFNLSQPSAIIKLMGGVYAQ